MFVLLESSPISTWELWVLGHHSDQRPSPPIAPFGQAASSRERLGGSKLLPFKNDGGHCVLKDLQCSIHFLVPFPKICALTQSCLGDLRTIPSTSWLGFCSDMHCQLWELTVEVGSLRTLRLESLKQIFQPLHKFPVNKL